MSSKRNTSSTSPTRANTKPKQAANNKAGCTESSDTRNNPAGINKDLPKGTTKESSVKTRRTAAEKVEMVKVDGLVPNPWNPNHMTKEGFNELCIEVRRTSEIAKPIIARMLPDGKLEIVDGEHNWRAAKKVGLEEVPCVIKEMSDAEAKRQTFKRNQSGTHCPLGEGLLFSQMQEELGCSGRKFAKEIDVPDATIRIKQKYVKALALRKGCAPKKVRNVCAPDDDDYQKIAALPPKQVQAYVDLPACFRDKWLDAGANMTLFMHTFFFNDKYTTNGKALLEQLEEVGLLDLVDCKHRSNTAARHRFHFAGRIVQRS